MSYSDAAWERATTGQDVILKALSEEMHWFRATFSQAPHYVDVEDRRDGLDGASRDPDAAVTVCGTIASRIRDFL